MIKKISALVLALVLCLSVVVMPASAAGVDLGDATFAIALEWDKPSYKGGDTAILKLYADGADDLSFFTGAVTFGLSADVFDSSVHTNAVLRAGSTTAEWFEAYYTPGSSAIATVNATNTTKIKNANTAAENELYDWYVKVGFAKNGYGTHENSGTSYNGFYGTDFNPNEPFMTIAFTVKDDVPAGTAVRAAVTSGTYTAPSAAQPGTYIKTFKTPGEATTTANVPAASTDITKADTNTATNGGAVIEAAKEYEKSIVSFVKDQIRMDDNENYSEFSIRHIAKISKTDWETNFGTDEDANAAGTKNIKSIGFMFKANAELDKDTAANWLEANYADLTPGTQKQGDGFLCVPVSVVSTKLVADSYAFTCMIDEQTDKTNTLSSLAYVVWADDEGTVHFSYFEEVKTDSFETLYDAYVEAHK